MATIKKYNGSTWENAVVRKYGTASEIITPPTTIYTDGTAITAYTLKGNTIQDGTPTPSNPVEVNGVGNKTANLFDDTNIINIPNLGDRYGVELPSGTYSIYNDTDNNVYYGTNNWTGKQLACSSHSTATVQLNVGSGVGGFFIALNSASQGGCTIVEGSAVPTSYIPYGYKIPISTLQGSAVNYLGSVSSNRNIAKYVFDGTDNFTWTKSGSRSYSWFLNPYALPNHGKTNTPFLCTHGATVTTVSDYQYGTVYADNTYNLGIFPTEISTVAELREWFAENPVTIWYVMDTSTTAAINEPLMKIGDYADSISNAAQIPTAEGANSITVDTTVQPSEFTATWTGWHDSSVKEYDGSQWQ